jgi:hypothetical protein
MARAKHGSGMTYYCKKRGAIEIPPVFTEIPDDVAEKLAREAPGHVELLQKPPPVVLDAPKPTPAPHRPEPRPARDVPESATDSPRRRRRGSE